MAFTHGKDAVLLVNTTALQTFLTNATFTQNAETAETSTIGVLDRTFIRSLAGHEFSCEGYFDRTATTGPDAVIQPLIKSATAATINWRPEGSGTGKISYDSSAFFTSYESSADFDGVVAFNAEGTVTGAVTRTVQV